MVARAHVAVATGAEADPLRYMLQLSDSPLFNTFGWLTPDAAGFRYCAAHIIEGVVLHSFNKRGQVAHPHTGAPALLHITALQTKYLSYACGIVQAHSLFDSTVVCTTVSETAHLFLLVGRVCTNPRLTLEFSMLRLLPGHGDGWADATHGFCASIPYGGRGQIVSLAEVGHFMIMAGPRATTAVRQDVVGQFRLVTDTVWNVVEHMFPYVPDFEMQGTFFFHALNEAGPPVQLRSAFCDRDSIIGEFSRRVSFWHANNEAARMTFVCDAFDLASFKWPAVHAVALTFGNGQRSFIAIKSMLARITGKAQIDDYVGFLDAADVFLQGHLDHIMDHVTRKGLRGIELTSAIAIDNEVLSVKASSGDAGDDDDDATSSKLAVRGSTLTVTARSMASTVRHPTFLALRASTEDKLNKNETLSEKKLYNLLSKLMGSEGSLVFCQVLLRHPQIKDSHEFLALVHRLKTSIPTYLSYGLVVQPSNGKREGASASFVIDAGLVRNWCAGMHTKINFHRSLALQVEAAIYTASRIASGEEFDFFLDVTKFQATRDMFHRISIMFGLAAKPSSGYSVLDCFEWLDRLRKQVLSCSAADQPARFQALADLYVVMCTEGGAFWVFQMDDNLPAGKRLEGYLAAVSGTGGFIKMAKTQVKGYEKLEKFALNVPGAGFGTTDYVAGESIIKSWSQVTSNAKTSKGGKKRGRDSGGGGDGDADDKGSGDKASAIGSCGKRVKWLTHSGHKDKDYYAVGTGDDPKVMGPLRELAKELKVEYSSRCWVVICSSKPDALKSTMCDEVGKVGHTSKTKKMHSLIRMKASTRKKFCRPMSEYLKKYPRQPASGGALPSSATV